MTHLASTLPSKVEIGAIRRLRWATEVVTTDGGYEVRNGRWASPLRTYQISFPISKRDDPTYEAVLELYDEAQGELHSFDFKDWTTGELVPVRFDGDLTTNGVTPEYDHLVEITLIEVRLAAVS